MLSNLFYAILTAVVVTALLRGGRPERRAALALLAGNIACGLVQAILWRRVPALAFLAVDAFVLAVLLRTAAFRPSLWLGAICALQLAPITLDVVWLEPSHPRADLYEHIAFGVSYAQFALLTYATAARWFGPRTL